MQGDCPFGANGSGPSEEDSTRNILQTVETDRSFLRASGRKLSSIESPLLHVKSQELCCLNGRLSTARVLSSGDTISGPCYNMTAPVVALPESSTINMLQQASQRKSSAGWTVVTHSFLEGEYIEFNFHEGRMVEIEAVDGKENMYSFKIAKLYIRSAEGHEEKDILSLSARDVVPVDHTVNVKGAPEDFKNRVTALTSMVSSVSSSELENSLYKQDLPIRLSKHPCDAAGYLIRKLECLQVIHGSDAKDIATLLRPSLQEQAQSCSNRFAVSSSSVCECSLAYEIDLKSSPYPGILKPSPHVFAEHTNTRDLESNFGRIEQLKRQWLALHDDPITSSTNFTYPHESIHSPNLLSVQENSQRDLSSALKDAHRSASLNIRKPNTPRRCSTSLTSLRVAKSQGIAKKSAIFDTKSCSSPAWSWRSPVKSTKDFVAQHSGFSTSAGKLSLMSSPCSSHTSQSSKTATAFHNSELKSPSSTSIPPHFSKSNSHTDSEPLSMKNVRCLPVPRITQGSGKLNLFSPRQHNSGSTLSLTACPQDPCTMVSGHVHCLVMDGVPSYTFLIKGSDEALVARSWRLGSTKLDFMYAFYSWKQRGKGLGSWKNWKRKDKPDSDFLGKMTATRKVIRETIQHPSSTERKYVNLEYVLFKESIHDQETNPFARCIPRESASSWDTLSCQSPNVIGINSPLSPSFLQMLSPPPVVLDIPSPRIISSFPSPAFSSVPQNLATLPMRAQTFGNQGRFPQSQCSPMRLVDESYLSPLRTVYKNPLGKVEAESSLDSHLEHAAVVIKIPFDTNTSTSLGDALTLDQNRGWGWRSLQKQTLLEAKSFIAESNSLHNDGRQSTLPTSDRRGERMKENGKVASNSSRDSRATLGKPKPKGKENKSEASSGKPVRNDATKEQVNVTIILPAGEHGRPFYGLSGPQPLIERWQHGGRCDCGSWDLGCGLSILHAKLPPDTMKLAESSQPGMRNSGENETEDTSLTMFLQGSKAVMSLKPLSDGLCSLTFQAPLSALQAFASAVAILYSMEPVTEQGKQGTLTEELSKPSRVPFKPIENCGRI